ncbi:MAG: glycine--tRNA ligase [Candidatus Absconditabacterales bacterium]|nr:glycine--tRNA ligase [Candidatus Absconditabacterales bacterium]
MASASSSHFGLDIVVARAKRKGFVYPGSDIYGGLANSWDYGPYGSLVKKNIADARWQYFVQERDDIYGMDTAILAHPRTWEASGHVSNFGDFLIDDKKTGQRFRPDKLIEDDLEQKRQSLSEEDLLKFLAQTYGVENTVPESWGPDVMLAYMKGESIKNPDTKKDAEWTDIRKFTLMLSTHLGPIEGDASKVWMRPETCQSLFTNFKNILNTTRARIPFGLAQIGKAFRNEITPGQFLYRTREFEQMEIEYFVPNDPEIALKSHQEWRDISLYFWHHIIKLNPDRIRVREHEQDELSHYSSATMDVEYLYPWGWGELQGLAYRGNFDLTQHQQFSGTDMQYHDPKTGKRYVPHVIEPSFGLSRTVMAVFLDCYDEEVIEKNDGSTDTRVVIRFPFALAPVKYAIFPLMEKDEAMMTLARDLFKKLSKKYYCEFDSSGNIGKRYRRQDEIGTPYCLTIDHQSLEDGTITIRDRDTMKQERISIDSLLG